MSKVQLSWTMFETCCDAADGKDVHARFEDLCRQLFAKEFLDDDSHQKYLLSAPNNPGIEAEPVLARSGEWAGFQAKYFTNKIDYGTIRRSFELTVEKYRGKIDKVVFYCNKTPSIRSRVFIEAKNILDGNGISLVLICDEAIFDRVREYSYLQSYYFGIQMLHDDWVKRHDDCMFELLNARYDFNFNVDTTASSKLSLFAVDTSAINKINSKKSDLLEKTCSIGWIHQDKMRYLIRLREEVKKLPDVGHVNVEEAFSWYSQIRRVLEDDLSQLEAEKAKIENLIYLLSQHGIDDETWQTYHDESNELEKLDNLLELPDVLKFSDEEINLVRNKTLAVHGIAGSGKSHMFAHEVQNLLDEGRCAVLLLANMYASKDPIKKQILANLDLECSFDEFLDMLDVKGAENRHPVLVCIDAINETGDVSLWKSQLSSIISDINKREFVKLAFSYRTEFEDCLINVSLVEDMDAGRICRVKHKGFLDLPIEFSEEFLNHYGVPFPLEFVFNEALFNPLFLKLYCKTYSGGELSLSAMYDALIKRANEGLWKNNSEALKIKGCNESCNILQDFIDEFADHLKGFKTLVLYTEIAAFHFWTDYGLAPKPFLNAITQEGVITLYPPLHNTDDAQYLYGFTYDNMKDYFLAKSLMTVSSKEEARSRIRNEILRIDNGVVINTWASNLFANACVLYSKEFHEECIDIIDDIRVPDNESIIKTFFMTFKWRDKETVDVDIFWNLLEKYQVPYETVFDILVHNSLKLDHPLNAEYLHSILSGLSLSDRDQIWTSTINDIEEFNIRLMNLVLEYDKGKGMACNDTSQKKLLLILFSWLLTSSNRELRDRTSKAMIEILKKDFPSCLFLLRKFEDVNDPYVIQRLYGIVFGACCKRINVWQEQYEELAEYVYSTIFDRDEVYPDVLLRDYARLIIELFLKENPSYNGVINKGKTEPSYKSVPVPMVSEDFSNYNLADTNRGTYKIVASMKQEEMGWYGDFGRYVFERALRNFDVDRLNLFNYAITFILNELGYTDEKFSGIDDAMQSLDGQKRYMRRVERIGKKYQWIALYNILARVSDNCLMKDIWTYGDKDKMYEGPWEPFVRDFDPTLNENFMVCDDAPILKKLEGYMNSPVGEDESCKTIKDNIIQMGEDCTQWVILYCDIPIKRLVSNNLLQDGFVTMRSSFVTKECKFFAVIKQNQLASLFPWDVFRQSDYYIYYNREYPWTHSCKEINEKAWVEECESWIHEHNVEQLAGIAFLQSTNSFLWETEYDWSKSDRLSWRMPCAELIDCLNLHRNECDCAFYDESNKLATFFRKYPDNSEFVMIRKDLLDKFLKDTGMQVIWLMTSERYDREVKDVAWAPPLTMASELGLFRYEDGGINGIVTEEPSMASERLKK